MAQEIRYAHTNLVARDWRALSQLRLPGHGPEGPTLEVFSYEPLGLSSAS
jgi:hypothetical protein